MRSRTASVPQDDSEPTRRSSNVRLDLDVARLEIAVGDAFLVGFFECGRYLSSHRQGLVERQWTFDDPFGERHPLDELHHQVVGSHVVQRADIGMVERGDSPRLALESLAELLGGELEGDFAPKTDIGRAEHFTHPASAELGRDAIVADRLSDHPGGPILPKEERYERLAAFADLGDLVEARHLPGPTASA